ncbi:MAG: hypothetical protein JXN64_10275 [Spirochaetes bacterium]|nr:hypothetical protein [Spirochaetota bacterium]
MKHVSQKQLISYLLDTAGMDAGSGIKEHIESCDDCRQKYNSLVPVIESYLKTRAVLSDSVRERIMRSASECRSAEEHKAGLLQSIYGYKRKFVLSAAASVVFMFLIAGLWILMLPDSENVYLRIARIYGRADIDYIPARTHYPAGSGTVISTGHNSAILLKHQHNYRLLLLGKSSLEIEKAKLTKNNIELKYRLNRGSVVNAYSRQDAGAVHTFNTPHTVVNTENADFFLQATDEKSRVLLLSGTLVLGNKNTAEEIIIDSPGEYTVSMDEINSEESDLIPVAKQKLDDAFYINDKIDDEMTASDNFYVYPDAEITDNSPEEIKSITDISDLLY